MATWDKEFRLILKHTVRIGRRSSPTVTPMGDRRAGGETTIAVAASVYFDYFAESERHGGSHKRYLFGEFKNLYAHLYMAFDQDCQEGDLLYPVVGPVGLTVGRIVFHRTVMDFAGNSHHCECGLEKVG